MLLSPISKNTDVQIDSITGGLDPDYFDGGAARDNYVDFSAEDTRPETLGFNLVLDQVRSREASDGDWFSDDANELYFQVAGNAGAYEFGPVRVGKGGPSGTWSLDTGESLSNITITGDDLRVGESKTIIVTAWDHDSSAAAAVGAFVQTVVASVP